MTREAPDGAIGALARDLHDGPLQTLGVAMLQLDLCQQLASTGRLEDVNGLLDEIRTQIVDACADLRTLMSALRQMAAEGELIHLVR